MTHPHRASVLPTLLANAFFAPHYPCPLFHRLEREAKERNVTLDTHVSIGHAADQILKAAVRHKAGMIVVGHRGRSAIQDFMHASCPALVVRAR